jgi:xanthine dehydrogenase accessory factor
MVSDPIDLVQVTVASVKGSVPRGPGTKMLVTADKLFGTIGGGHLEYIAIDAARRQLGAGAPAQLHRFRWARASANAAADWLPC